MMGAARKHDKARGKDKDVKNAQPALDLPRIYGCPVPDPVQCSIGKPILPGEDGVTMECSNEKCPFASQLLHQLCFESFEDHLVKVLSNLGSARGWTDAQRRANLWDKKGQSLIAKVCRCRCGLGMTRMDEIAAYDRQKRRTQDEQMTRARAGTVITDFIATGTKKKCKSKATLPKLNFGLVKVSPQAQVEERELRNAVSNRRSNRQRESSISSLSSPVISSNIFESRREFVTYAMDSWQQISAYSPHPRTQSVTSSHVDQDFMLSPCVRNEIFQPDDLVPAPLPPRQTRSYASAIKRSDTPPQSDIAVERIGSVPLSIRTDLCDSDSGIEMKSGSTTGSDFSDIVKDSISPVKTRDFMLPSLAEKPNTISTIQDTLCTRMGRARKMSMLSLSLMGPELVRDSFVAFSAELPDEYHRVIKAKSSPRATSVSPATDAYVNNIYQMLAYDAPENFEWSVGEWCAFKGTNFCLGEALVANSYLPAWNSHVERV